jgi:hypothetical protein
MTVKRKNDKAVLSFIQRPSGSASSRRGRLDANLTQFEGRSVQTKIIEAADNTAAAAAAAAWWHSR